MLHVFYFTLEEGGESNAEKQNTGIYFRSHHVLCHGLRHGNLQCGNQTGGQFNCRGVSNMTNLIFWEALKEASYMGLLVLLFSNLWGNRIGASFASKHCDPSKDSPYICQLPAIWVGTFFKNFPMAFFWNMFAAAPFTHWLFKKIFHQA